MKKVMLILSLIILPMFGIFVDKANAEPAPPLTNLQIIGVTSDGNNYVWEDIDFGQQSAVTSMSGTQGYLAVYIEGTGRNLRIFNNGMDITTYTYQAANTDYLTDANNIIYGEIRYYGVPLSAISAGDFSVRMTDYYPPNYNFYDHLFIDVVK